MNRKKEARPQQAADGSALTIRGQVFAVGAATFISLLFARGSRVLFPDFHAAYLPGGAAFIWASLGVGLVWGLYVLDARTLARSVELATGEAGGLLSRPPGSRRYRAYAAVSTYLPHIGLYAFVIGCVTLLAWFTLPTGGTLHSPYRDALLAVALLSPFISRRFYTPLIIGALVLAEYFVFSEFVIPNPSAEIHVPPELHALTTVATTVTAIGVAVFVKQKEQKRNDRALTAAKEPALAPKSIGNQQTPSPAVEISSNALPSRYLTAPPTRLTAPRKTHIQVTGVRTNGGSRHLDIEELLCVNTETGQEVTVRPSELISWVGGSRHAASVKVGADFVPVAVRRSPHGAWVQTRNGTGWTEDLLKLPRF